MRHCNWDAFKGNAEIRVAPAFSQWRSEHQILMYSGVLTRACGGALRLGCFGATAMWCSGSVKPCRGEAVAHGSGDDRGSQTVTQ